jgi:MerR family mercuric resistance operon transcriptional regulator
MGGLTIGRLARTAGVHLETVRYYERIGLMPAPDRTEGGHRSYAVAHVRRLRFIRRARDLGFTLDDVRALLELAEPGHGSCREVQKIASLHLQGVRAKLADLARMEKLLATTVAQCSGEQSPACPVLEMLDTAETESGQQQHVVG